MACCARCASCGRAARRLGEGELRTRVAVRGSDELADVARTFNNTAAELERHVGELRRMEADARRFVADVSHELRTPLAAMTAVTDVLDEEAARLPGDAGTAARLVSQETHKLTRLVDDLIEISRFDAGARRSRSTRSTWPTAMRATLRARGWSEQVQTELPAGVDGRLDPRRLDVIVANLVGNALRHGAPPVTSRAGACRPDGLDRRGQRQRAGAGRRTCCRTCSTGSTRRTPPGPGPRAAASAWPSRGRTRGCTAAA